MTQADIAEALGVSGQRYVSRCVTGATEPSEQLTRHVELLSAVGQSKSIADFCRIMGRVPGAVVAWSQREGL